MVSCWGRDQLSCNIPVWKNEGWFLMRVFPWGVVSQMEEIRFVYQSILSICNNRYGCWLEIRKKLLSTSVTQPVTSNRGWLNCGWLASRTTTNASNWWLSMSKCEYLPDSWWFIIAVKSIWTGKALHKVSACRWQDTAFRLDVMLCYVLDGFFWSLHCETNVPPTQCYMMRVCPFHSDLWQCYSKSELFGCV